MILIFETAHPLVWSNLQMIQSVYFRITENFLALICLKLELSLQSCSSKYAETHDSYLCLLVCFLTSQVGLLSPSVEFNPTHDPGDAIPQAQLFAGTPSFRLKIVTHTSQS